MLLMITCRQMVGQLTSISISGGQVGRFFKLNDRANAQSQIKLFVIIVPGLRATRWFSGRTTAVLVWVLFNPENRLNMLSVKALMVSLEMNA
jgi:hypothetical protein